MLREIYVDKTDKVAQMAVELTSGVVKVKMLVSEKILLNGPRPRDGRYLDDWRDKVTYYLTDDGHWIRQWHEEDEDGEIIEVWKFGRTELKSPGTTHGPAANPTPPSRRDAATARDRGR